MFAKYWVPYLKPSVPTTTWQAFTPSLMLLAKRATG
jgi:hypothetical protein